MQLNYEAPNTSNKILHQYSYITMVTEATIRHLNNKKKVNTSTPP